MSFDDFKICTICKISKHIDFFYNSKRSFDGKDYRCGKCARDYAKEYRDKNRTKVNGFSRKWDKSNIEKKKKTANAYYWRNREEISKKRSILYSNPEHKKKKHDYYVKNKEKLKISMKKWIQENRKRSNEIKKNWKKRNPEAANVYARRKRKSIKFRIGQTFSVNMRMSLKGRKNGRHWEFIIGYTIENLMKYLESLFTPGMNWDNYGKDGWEIDHIIPIAKFNYRSTIDIDFQKCWALDNLQPLWATTQIIDGVEYLGNRNKGDRI